MPLLFDSKRREQSNPLRNLTLEKILAWESQADKGEPSDLQWFYRFMERGDVTVQAAVNRRLSYLANADWEIRTEKNADPGLAQAQADVLRYQYAQISNLKSATLTLGEAIFRGFAHLEKTFSADGSKLVKLTAIPQWHWSRDGMLGDWKFNKTAQSWNPSTEAIDRSRFVIHEAQPLHVPISRNFFNKTAAHLDWDTALQVGANPSVLLEEPPGTDEGDHNDFVATAQALGSAGRGTVPSGTKVHVIDTIKTGQLPYKERIDYSDQQIVMAATGGILTMLTQSGSGTLAGGAHSQSLLALARNDAQQIAETFQRDLDLPWLSAYFPRHPPVAYFAFDVPQEQDTMSLLSAVSNLSWAGFTVDQKQLEEKTGLKLVPLNKPPEAPQ